MSVADPAEAIARLEAQRANASETPVSDEGSRFTDVGNALRLVEAHGHDLRYVAGVGWFVWDERRWRPDVDRLGVQHRAKLTAQAITAEGLRRKRADDSDDKLLRWGLRSETAPKIEAMVKLARDEAAIVTEQDAFDAHPDLLNVLNGTLCLRTGELRPHAREDLLTKIAPVAYDPEALAPRFESFLQEIFDGDAALVSYVQRAIGYSISGDISEQVAFLAHGAGANGKSTLLEAVAHALGGDYCAAPDPATFTTLPRRNVRSDLALLAGVRYVRTAETASSMTIDESLLKRLTGGERISAARLYHDETEFLPQLKLWIAANHLPTVEGDDLAIWRRLRVLPFGVTITDPDKGLAAKLRAEAEGILAWAVAGAVEWYREGLGACAAVERATAAYRHGEDRVGEFLDACCVVERDARAENGELIAAYVAWEQEQGRTPLRDLHDRLGRRGFGSVKSNGKRYRTGVRLGAGTQRDGANNSPIPHTRGESL